MADLVLLLVLLVAVMLVVLVVSGARRIPGRDRPALGVRRDPAARWTAGHRGEAGRTVVHVELARPERDAPVLERHDVGAVDDDDPAYDRRLADLMQTARERAVLLDLNRE